MREIIFRGKRVDNGEWVYGYYMEDGLNNHYIIEIKKNNDKDYHYGKTYRYVEIIPETIGQFTGLYDKDKKPIYEGDIVKSPYLNDDSLYIITYWKCGFMLQGLKSGNYYDFIGDLLGTLEVVGNMYDKEKE